MPSTFSFSKILCIVNSRRTEDDRTANEAKSQLINPYKSDAEEMMVSVFRSKNKWSSHIENGFFMVLFSSITISTKICVERKSFRVKKTLGRKVLDLLAESFR